MSYEPKEQELFLKCLLEANVDGILAFDRELHHLEPRDGAHLRRET